MMPETRIGHASSTASSPAAKEPIMNTTCSTDCSCPARSGCLRGRLRRRRSCARRVLTQEAVQPANANAADEYGTAATLFGGPIGERLVPRHKTIEETTVDALARIGTPSVPALVAMLCDPDVELRKSAARALAKMGSEATPAVPDLIAALSDQDPEVRKFATRALGEIGPPAGDAIPALIEELRAKRQASGTGGPSGQGTTSRPRRAFRINVGAAEAITARAAQIRPMLRSHERWLDRHVEHLRPIAAERLATRSANSAGSVIRSAATPSDRAKPTMSTAGSARSMPTNCSWRRRASQPAARLENLILRLLQITNVTGNR